MIKVDIRYPSDSMLMDDDTIGFYSWEAFRNHFERIIKWGVPMTVLNVEGTDNVGGHTRQEAGIISCFLQFCGDHQDKPIAKDRDLARTQTDAAFVEHLNQRIRMAAKS